MFKFLFLQMLWEKHVTGNQSKWFLRLIFSPIPKLYVVRTGYDGSNHILAGGMAFIFTFMVAMGLDSQGYTFNLWYLFGAYLILGGILMIFKSPPGPETSKKSLWWRYELWIYFWIIELAAALALVFGTHFTMN